MINELGSVLNRYGASLNSGYLQRRLMKSNVKLDGANLFEKLMGKANQCKGEHFNNAVTAVGTAGVAPIFIIHNPLAKEDSSTKKYTAARQPISAIITLTAQVPIMTAYNNWVDKMATQYHLDRCDLSAAPMRSVVNKAIDFDYQKIKRDNPEVLQSLKKGNITDLLYQKYKDNAFYDELHKIRKSVLNGTEPEYLKKHFGPDGKIKIESMLAPSDFAKAERDLIVYYLKQEHGIQFVGENVIEFVNNDKKEKITVNSLSDLRKSKKFAKFLKANNINLDFKELSEQASKDRITELAKMNVECELRSSAKIKFKSAQMYNEAKKELSSYIRKLSAEGVTASEADKLIQQKEKELFEKLVKDAKAILASAPDAFSDDIHTLNKKEAETLVNKISSKLSMFSRDLELSEPEKVVEKAKRKVYDCFKNETKIKFLKTEGRETFDSTLRDVQLKKWLKARINNSEKILSDFKQKSGIVVGLAILPLTCGLLNWAYPRIMEEWFPNLAHSKKAAAEKKEVK
ncbi:MAG: hypothetical protein KHX03_07780 [Clostridium sp.]|nr:hypothetical protein [Clostridium sp.]